MSGKMANAGQQPSKIKQTIPNSLQGCNKTTVGSQQIQFASAPLNKKRTVTYQVFVYHPKHPVHL